MATHTYSSFSSKQGLLVGNGGGWTCRGFDSSCSQNLVNNNYGPISSTSTPNSSSIRPPQRYMTLSVVMNIADDEFKGATTVPSTISFNVQATAQGGSPDPITLDTNVGGSVYTYPDRVQYNAPNPISVTRSGRWGARPTEITLSVEAKSSNFGTATVTLAISDLTFVIHDVVYGVTSMPGASSPSVSLVSPSSSNSNSGLISTSSTTNGTSLLHPTSITTTISGHETVIGSTLPPPSNSDSQSYPTIPSKSRADISMTANERAGIIAGSLVGLGIILIAIAFWYRWWRRGRRAHSRKAPRGDEQSPNADSRMVNQDPRIPRPFLKRLLYDPTTENEIPESVEDERAEPWVPRPYRKRPYSHPIPETVVVPPVADQRAEPAQLNGQEAAVLSIPRSEIASSYRLHRPPPAYSQITPRQASRSSVIAENA